MTNLVLPEEQTKEMDVRRAPSFDPSQKHVTSFSLLRSLDLFPALGLAPADFWTLFSRCQMCNHYMTTRTIPYHRCPAMAFGWPHIATQRIRAADLTHRHHRRDYYPGKNASERQKSQLLEPESI